MPDYVIGPDVALHLAKREADVRGGHRLLAPTLLRSQVLSLLYSATREGAITKKDADRQLDYLRSLRIRFLGRRVQIVSPTDVLHEFPEDVRCRPQS
jgi:hypothetical protein